MFAVRFLMLSTTLKKFWTSRQRDVSAQAGYSTLSEGAMQIRLVSEGLLGED